MAFTTSVVATFNLLQVVNLSLFLAMFEKQAVWLVDFPSTRGNQSCHRRYFGSDHQSVDWIWRGKEFDQVQLGLNESGFVPHLSAGTVFTSNQTPSVIDANGRTVPRLLRQFVPVDSTTAGTHPFETPLQMSRTKPVLPLNHARVQQRKPQSESPRQVHSVDQHSTSAARHHAVSPGSSKGLDTQSEWVD